MQRVEECRRILLDAGADPTLTGSDDINLLEIAVLDGALVSVYKARDCFMILILSGHNDQHTRHW